MKLETLHAFAVIFQALLLALFVVQFYLTGSLITLVGIVFVAVMTVFQIAMAVRR